MEVLFDRFIEFYVLRKWAFLGYPEHEKLKLSMLFSLGKGNIPSYIWMTHVGFVTFYVL